MACDPKYSCVLALRLMLALSLLGWPRVGSAQGTWSVIATGGTTPGQVNGPSALAVDPAGNLYVADTGYNRVQEYSPDSDQ